LTANKLTVAAGGESPIPQGFSMNFICGKTEDSRG
jgi:hypothetical protein